MWWLFRMLRQKTYLLRFMAMQDVVSDNGRGIIAPEECVSLQIV